MSRKALLGILFGLSVGFAQECDKVSVQDLRKHLPFIPDSVEIVQKREVAGLCEVVIAEKGYKPAVFYLGKDFVLAGVLFQKGQNITMSTIKSYEQEQVKKLIPKLDELVSAEYGQGQKTVYFISDPDCPFCEGIKNRLTELAKKNGYKVKLIFFPLTAIHPNAEKKAVSFVCEKRSFEDYLQGKYGSADCEQGRQKVRKAIEELSSVVGGTPTFIFSDGRKLEGGNPQALEDMMK